MLLKTFFFFSSVVVVVVVVVVFVFRTSLSFVGNWGIEVAFRSKVQQPQEERYPFLSVCAVLPCVQTMVWLPVFGISNMHTAVDACHCTRGLYGHRKRVCTGNTLRAPLSGTFLQTLPDYVSEGTHFISAQLSTDAVSALRKVWVLIRLWKQPSAQAHT